MGEWRRRFESNQPEGESALPPPKPMPALLWSWLKSRGLTEGERIDEFFSPKLSGLTHPFKLKDMELAVGRLVTAYVNQEKICVYGDYDLDGSSGIALLVAGLRGLGFRHVSFYQPSRFLEGYGIHSEALEVIAARGDRVVISVDCGITAVDEALKAKTLGLDLIITDHHLARRENDVEIIPSAVAVINPNQEADRSGLGHLAGVGVGFYLLLGVKSVLKESTFDLKTLLDFFSIGTITDMVPLRNENRVLLKHGLKVLSQTTRPGIQALLKRLNVWGRDLDSMDVAFTIAPKLNALSRLELGLRPLEVLMCTDEKTGEILAEQVIELNEKRKSFQAELEEKILNQLPHEIDKPAIVLAAEGHAGIVGLVATKVTQTTGKPAFIVAWHDGEGIGSARGAEQDHLPRGLAAAGEYLERFGGHAQAAGFSLAPSQFEDFKTALLTHYETKSTHDVSALSEKKYDVEAKLSDFSESFMTWIKHAGPFGTENPAPLFRVVDPLVADIRWLKGEHLKLTLEEEGLPRSIEALAFFARSAKIDVEKGSRFEILVEPSWNYFRGERRLQLLIRDLKPL